MAHSRLELSQGLETEKQRAAGARPWGTRCRVGSLFQVRLEWHGPTDIFKHYSGCWEENEWWQGEHKSVYGVLKGYL